MKIHHLIFLTITCLTSSLPASKPQPQAPALYAKDQTSELYVRHLEFISDLKKERDAILDALASANSSEILQAEVLYNTQKLHEKKKQLEELLHFLCESEIRAEQIAAEFTNWVLTSPKIDEETRSWYISFREQLPEDERNFSIHQSYGLNKSITEQYIQLADFLLGRQGTYKKGDDNVPIFANTKDANTYQGHLLVLLNLDEQARTQKDTSSQDPSQLIDLAYPPLTKNSSCTLVSPTAIAKKLQQAITRLEVLPLKRALKVDSKLSNALEHPNNPKQLFQQSRILEEDTSITEETEELMIRDIPSLIEKYIENSKLNEHARKKLNSLNQTLLNSMKTSLYLRKKQNQELLNLEHFLRSRIDRISFHNGQAICLFGPDQKLYMDQKEKITALTKKKDKIDAQKDKLLRKILTFLENANRTAQQL